MKKETKTPKKRNILKWVILIEVLIEAIKQVLKA